ncbi:MAG: hypothetical protein NW237_16890 [Cyanobacteriota bacterium]|nr:hypothetical protein [Cyanobacteriota bacterium]
MRVDPDQDWIELVERERINLADVVAWTRMADGSLVWLERGNQDAGLRHIISRHERDFAEFGIPAGELSEFLIEMVRNGEPVMMQGTRQVYRVFYRGQDWHVAVTVGDNGFIVGANPVGQRKLRQLLRKQNAPTRPTTS